VLKLTACAGPIRIFLKARALAKKNWSHPPDSNRRPGDYESETDRHTNREDPNNPNDFGILAIWSLGLFGSLGKHFSDRTRTTASCGIKFYENSISRVNPERVSMALSGHETRNVVDRRFSSKGRPSLTCFLCFGTSLSALFAFLLCKSAAEKTPASSVIGHSS